jgi:type II secretory pathway component PulF
VLEDDPDKKMAEIVRSLIRRVDSGHALSSALAAHPGVFSQMYLMLVRVAEMTGGITRVFDRLAMVLERQGNLRTRLTGALVYPLFVLVTTVGMAFFLLYFLLPMFLKTFEQSGQELPWLTRMLSVVAGNKLFLLLPPLVVVTVWGAIHLYTRKPENRAKFQNFLFRVPGLGRFLFLMSLAQVTDGLALLLENGVDLMRSLDCLRRSPTGWRPLDEAIAEIQNRVFEGDELSEAMRAQGIFPPLLINLIGAGETVGTLHPWFARYTKLIEEELQETVDSMVSILEPALLLFLGGAVGVVVLACFLPTYQLMNSL